MRQFVNLGQNMKTMNSKILLYLIVSFGFSWIIAAIIWKIDESNPIIKSGLYFLFMCGPGIAGLICAWRFNKGQRVKVLGLSGPWTVWFLWTWLLGIVLILGSSAIHYLSPSVSPVAPVVGLGALLEEAGQGALLESVDSIPYVNLVLIAQWLLLAPLINIPLMLSEELGWRGWLWHELRLKGFWIASFWIGLLWGLWHIPIIALGHNYPGMPIWGPIFFTVFCVLYSPIFSLVREKSKSVWGPCILHATTNGAAALGFAIQSSTEMPWRGVVGVGGFIMISVLTLWVWKQKPLVNKAVTVSP